MSKERSTRKTQIPVGKILAVLGAMAIIALIFMFAPMFHWFWYDILYRHITLVFVIFIGLCGTVVAALETDDIGYGFPWFLMPFVGGILLAVILLPIFNGLTQQKLAALPFTTMSELPDTQQVRYLPLEIAKTYGQSKVQESDVHLDYLDPLDENGELVWVAPRVPTGYINQFSAKSDGFAVIQPDGSVETVRQQMEFGEDMIFFDNIRWQLLSKEYFSEIPDIYYLKVNGEVLAMAPYIVYDYEFPVTVPRWGGVFVVHSSGQIEELTPDQAIADPRFVGQRLYPESLTKRIVDSWQFKGGMMNAWFTHQDQIEIPSLDNTENQMPYLIPTKDGPQWMVATEPYGSSSHGLFKLFFTDAHTGKMSVYSFASDSSLVGPNRALGFVQSAFPNYKWGKGLQDNVAIEPRPVIRNGNIFWMASVTTGQHANIITTVMVNAHDPNGTDIRYFNTYEEVKAFIAGTFEGHRPANGVDSSTDPSQTGATPQITDLSKLSQQELLDLLKQVASELEKRSQTK